MIDWESLLRDAPTGFDASAQDRDQLERSAGPGASIYGEILPQAARRLLRWFALDRDDVFADLGSGAGRLVIQAACETPVGRALGIELSADRHRAALAARRTIAAAMPDPARWLARVELRNEDLRHSDLRAVTHAWLAATTWSAALLADALRQLDAQATRLRTLVVTRPLPPPWDRRFPARGEFDLDMSWAPKVRVHVRRRA